MTLFTSGIYLETCRICYIKKKDIQKLGMLSPNYILCSGENLYVYIQIFQLSYFGRDRRGKSKFIYETCYKKDT